MKVNKTTAFGLLRLLMGRLQTESTGLLNKAEAQSASIDWVLAVFESVKYRDPFAQVLVGHDLGWHIVTQCPLYLLREDIPGSGPYQIKMETEQRLMVMGLDVCPKTGIETTESGMLNESQLSQEMARFIRELENERQQTVN